jgi:outer membrane protein assembly factor BamA
VGQQYYRDIEQTVKVKEDLQSLAVAYSLNRFQQVELLAGTVDRRESWKDASQNNFHKRENVAGLAFVQDIVQGPYLEATSGYRLRLDTQFSGQVLGGDYVYQNYTGEINYYFPLGREHVLGVRSLFGESFGQDAQLFRLGGETGVRGVQSTDDIAGSRLFITNLEWRFPVVYNINYHMWYIFPDFFFKTLYGSLFVDGGTAWNEGTDFSSLTIDQWKGSYGLGLRFHTFILQMYPLLMNRHRDFWRTRVLYSSRL